MNQYIPVVIAGLMLAPAILLASENKISQSDKLVKSMTVAQFKGDCLRMKGTLSYDDKQWTCTGKNTEKGLTSIPVKLPQ